MRMPRSAADLLGSVAPLARAQTVAEVVASQLIDLVAQGHLKAGDKLPSEHALAKSFRVGRGAIREALRTLAIEGLVTIQRGTGTFVSPRTSFFFRTVSPVLRAGAEPGILTEARSTIEGELAALAAGRTSPDEILGMEILIDRMARNTDSEHVKQFLQADVEFHFAIALAARNPILSEFLTLIRNLIQDQMFSGLHRLGVAPGGVQHHRMILQAIRRGEATAARDAMRSHVEADEELLLAGGAL